MKFYFGNYTKEHEERGIDKHELLYNRNNDAHYFYVLEFDEDGEVTLTDSIGSILPLNAEDMEGLVVGATLANKFYKGKKENEQILEYNNAKLLQEMAQFVASKGGSSDVC